MPLDYTASVQLAWVLVDLGRPAELAPRLEGLGAPPWADVSAAIARGAFEEAADRLAEMACFSEEAYARLRAARVLAEGGRRQEADAQLRRAIDFYRSVGARRFIDEGQALLAKST